MQLFHSKRVQSIIAGCVSACTLAGFAGALAAETDSKPADEKPTVDSSTNPTPSSSITSPGTAKEGSQTTTEVIPTPKSDAAVVPSTTPSVTPIPTPPLPPSTTAPIAPSTNPPVETYVHPVAPPKPLPPADRPAPKGQDAVVKLYSQKKFAQAAKEFQQYIKDGTADVNTHAYLAYCLYNMRQYHQAVKQFDWVAKYATKSLTLQRSAEASARTLRNYFAGVCPGDCLKRNDPRWQYYPGLDPSVRWIKWSARGGWSAISEHHIGQLVTFNNGEAHPGPTCPICGGTGTVPVLHDGDPVPH